MSIIESRDEKGRLQFTREDGVVAYARYESSEAYLREFVSSGMFENFKGRGKCSEAEIQRFFNTDPPSGVVSIMNLPVFNSE